MSETNITVEGIPGLIDLFENSGIAVSDIKASPEKIQSTAEELNSETVKAKVLYESIKSRAEKTSLYWIGDAGNLHRSKLLRGDEQMQQIFSRYSAHSTALLNIAEIYLGIPVTADPLITSLPAPLISTII